MTRSTSPMFVPAMRAAGFEPWLPRASGAELVHAEFSRALCLAEMVLVDLSSLNPNVFFELGIRTARDGPVSLVCDDKTGTVPFDVGVLNYCQDSSALRVWELEKDLCLETANGDVLLRDRPERASGRPRCGWTAAPSGKVSRPRPGPPPRAV